MPKNVKKILIHFQLIKDTFQVDNKPIIKWQKYAIFFSYRTGYHHFHPHLVVV